MKEERKVMWGKKPIDEQGINELRENVRWIESIWISNTQPKKQAYPVLKARLAIQEWHEQYFAEHGAKEGYEKPQTPYELQKAYEDTVALYWELKDECEKQVLDSLSTEDWEAMYPNPNEKP
jgi:hypothetical protein